MPAIRLLIPVLAGLVAVAACSDPADESPGTGDTIPPVVTALAPVPGTQDVPVTARITIRFSEPINPATVGPASFLVREGSDSVPGAYAFGDSTASFVPEDNLAYRATYSVTVTRGIRDPAGNQLARDTAWGFLTAAQETPAPPRR